MRKLEDGDLSLEESLKHFEDGVKLSRECQERLNQAERRIEVLLKDENGNPVLNVIKAEDLREEKQPKIKRRIVFDDNEDDDEDVSPFWENDSVFNLKNKLNFLFKKKENPN